MVKLNAYFRHDIDNQSSESRTHSCLLIFLLTKLIHEMSILVWLFYKLDWLIWVWIQGHFFVQRYWIGKQILLLTFFWKFRFLNMYTANVYRELQGLYREIGVQGFQIYGDCMYTPNPCNFEISTLWFPCKNCRNFDFTGIL